MTSLIPRHEQVDDEHLDGGCLRLRCRCGWASPPVAALDVRLPSDEWDQVHAAHEAAWQQHFAPLVTPSPFQVLDLPRDSGGWRHRLAGTDVHAGSPLELLLPDGRWWAGRHESAWPPGWSESGPTAMFHAPLGGPWLDSRTDTSVQVHFPLPADAVLRWPARQDAR